jgi:hypothetical protein
MACQEYKVLLGLWILGLSLRCRACMGRPVQDGNGELGRWAAAVQELAAMAGQKR